MFGTGTGLSRCRWTLLPAPWLLSQCLRSVPERVAIASATEASRPTSPRSRTRSWSSLVTSVHIEIILVDVRTPAICGLCLLVWIPPWLTCGGESWHSMTLPPSTLDQPHPQTWHFKLLLSMLLRSSISESAMMFISTFCTTDVTVISLATGTGLFFTQVTQAILLPRCPCEDHLLDHVPRLLRHA